jgi:hypothetical protein
MISNSLWYNICDIDTNDNTTSNFTTGKLEVTNCELRMTNYFINEVNLGIPDPGVTTLVYRLHCKHGAIPIGPVNVSIGVKRVVRIARCLAGVRVGGGRLNVFTIGISQGSGFNVGGESEMLQSNMMRPVNRLARCKHKQFECGD